MRRLTGLVPTLLFLGLMPASAVAGEAGSASERDAHFEAVYGLIEGKLRLPAKRQLAEFRAANYVGVADYDKALSYFYAERFSVLSPDAAEKAALAKQAKELGPDLEKNQNRLPKLIAEKVGGTGKVVRLVSDILALINPDAPMGLSGLAGIPEEQKASVNQAVLILAAEAKDGFASAGAKIRAFDKSSDIEAAIAQNNMQVVEQATMLRLEAMRPLALAHKAMREVAERGPEYGIDPAPARKFLQEFTTANFKTIQDWDYAFGDYHPYLHAFCMDWYGDGVRFPVEGATFEDIENDIFKTLDADAAKDFTQPAIADEFRTLQARAWAGLFTWYRDLAREQGAKFTQRGLEKWQEFKERTKFEQHLRLNHPNAERAKEMAHVYFAVARLMLAAGDKGGAVSVFNQVAAVKGQPLAAEARMWVQSVFKNGANDAAKVDWGSQATAGDPAAAIANAVAFLRAADQNSDEAKARGFRFQAALALRDGALGLNNPADQDKADEAAPELWFRYAFVLNQLGLRWHAAVVTQEGLKQIRQRLADLPKDGNVWKAKDGSWTKAGNFISLMSRNGITYAQVLLMRAKGQGVSALYDSIVSQVNVVSPSDTGRSLEWLQVQIRLGEQDWDGAVEAARAYIKKYPDEVYRATADGIMQALRRKLREAKSVDEKKRIQADMIAIATALAAQAQKELDDGKADPARQKTLKAAINGVLLVKASFGTPDEVLTLVGPDYFKTAPTDEETAEAIGFLCQAVRDHFQAWEKDDKVNTDPKVLLANWARYQDAYETWHKQKARLPSQAERIEKEGAKLAQTFVNIGNAAERLRVQPDAPPALAQVAKTAFKAFSDLIEPRLSAADKPDLVLATANILWDLAEHERSARLYQIYVDQIAKDPDATALRSTPKDVLNPLDPLLGARPELKAGWAKIRDLLEDAPDLTRKILEQDLPQEQWGELKIDYVKAVAAIQAMRADLAKRKIEIGAAFVQLDEGLAKVEATASTLAREITAVGRLAVALQEQGKTEDANRYYDRMIAYDPTNPEYLAAAVELVLKQLSDGKMSDPKVIEATQVKAARVRDAAEPGSPTYWKAVIQVLEIAGVLKDTKAIDKRLVFDAQNRSTPADDLQQVPRDPRDDKRVRRARNAVSVDLCRRYLRVFTLPGVNAQPSFRIDTVELDGKATAIFVPVDAPKFSARKKELEDGTVQWFVWEDGVAEPAATPPPAAPEAKPPVAPVQEKKP